MNEIKKREKFRPFAVSVLQSKYNEYFEGLRESPTMMYAPKAKDLLKKLAPSVVHVDNTCRVQTVNEKDNLILHIVVRLRNKKTNKTYTKGSIINKRKVKIFFLKICNIL